jgi:hypothetical protein
VRGAGPLLLALEQQPTTRLGERLLATLLMLAVIAGLLLLMRRGWRRRAARQGHLPPPPPAPPAEPGEALLDPVAGFYVSTTTAGDWLDRVVAHGLGVRSRAIVHVTTAGVRVGRTGADDLWVPADALRGVRRERGMAGKYVEEGGLVVLTWALGEHLLDTGLRAPRSADGDALEAALAGLVAQRSAS